MTALEPGADHIMGRAAVPSTSPSEPHCPKPTTHRTSGVQSGTGPENPHPTSDALKLLSQTSWDSQGSPISTHPQALLDLPSFWNLCSPPPPPPHSCQAQFCVFVCFSISMFLYSLNLEDAFILLYLLPKSIIQTTGLQANEMGQMNL